MENFNLQLREFCQLTIDLVDVRQEKQEFIKNKDYEILQKFIDRENEIFEKVLTLVRLIQKEVEMVTINSKNVYKVQQIYSFLNLFTASNIFYMMATDAQLTRLKNKIEFMTINENEQKIKKLKKEIKKLEKAKINVANWWLSYY